MTPFWNDIKLFYCIRCNPKNKEEISAKLTEEIVKRYYFMEGAYQQKAHFDTAIYQAASLLQNSASYEKLLKN